MLIINIFSLHVIIQVLPCFNMLYTYCSTSLLLMRKQELKIYSLLSTKPWFPSARKIHNTRIHGEKQVKIKNEIRPEIVGKFLFLVL